MTQSNPVGHRVEPTRKPHQASPTLTHETQLECKVIFQFSIHKTISAHFLSHGRTERCDRHNGPWTAQTRGMPIFMHSFFLHHAHNRHSIMSCQQPRAKISPIYLVYFMHKPSCTPEAAPEIRRSRTTRAGLPGTASTTK